MSDPSTTVSDALLRAEQLQSHRGDRELFTNLNLTLSAGEAVQVVGPNGCGKTTLLRVLCGLVQPSAGQVSWRGTAIEHDRAAFHRELCYLGYAGGVKLELSPVENLRCAVAMQAEVPTLGVWEALDQVGLYGFEDVPGYTLSAGQRRRVSLARLLLAGVPLWILDEPLTALDDQGTALVERLLDAHVREGGVLVLTTHQPLRNPPSNTRALRLGQQ